MRSRAGVVVCLAADKCRTAARSRHFQPLQYHHRPSRKQQCAAFPSYPALVGSLRLPPNKLV